MIINLLRGGARVYVCTGLETWFRRFNSTMGYPRGDRVSHSTPYLIYTTARAGRGVKGLRCGGGVDNNRCNGLRRKGEACTPAHFSAFAAAPSRRSLASFLLPRYYFSSCLHADCCTIVIGEPLCGRIFFKTFFLIENLFLSGRAVCKRFTEIARNFF